jgi:hypothetical protein
MHPIPTTPTTSYIFASPGAYHVSVIVVDYIGKEPKTPATRDIYVH